MDFCWLLPDGPEPVAALTDGGLPRGGLDDAEDCACAHSKAGSGSNDSNERMRLGKIILCESLLCPPPETLLNEGFRGEEEENRYGSVPARYWLDVWPNCVR